MNRLSIVLMLTLVACCFSFPHNTNQERGMNGQYNSGTGRGNYEEGNRHRENQSSNLERGYNGLGSQGSQGNGYGTQGYSQSNQGHSRGNQGYSQSNQGHGRDTERHSQSNQGYGHNTQGQGYGNRQGQGGSQLNQHSLNDGYQSRGI